VLLSGFYLLLTALAAHALGGYFAGRMRRPYGPAENPDYDDGMPGLLVWGLATLLSVASNQPGTRGTVDRLRP
jgi:hypothetical protein